MSTVPSNHQAPPLTRRVELYDTTLRDGTQGAGVALSLVDKLKITSLLDELGFDFVEGGYPLSNPKDVAYFQEVAKLDLQHAKVVAFGMTRRRGITADQDQGMNALVDSKSPVITIVGKTWDLHVTDVLSVTLEENLDMIRESVAFCSAADHVEQVFYDAEHFFDGYQANPDYAIKTLRAAVEGGATRLVLCDTNGGSMPEWIVTASQEVANELDIGTSDDPTQEDGPFIAIHPHNDSGVAVANALSAVKAGAVQVQGTINGIGERCGNVDLITVAADLRLKSGVDCLLPNSLSHLRRLSRSVYDLANLAPVAGQPFVGDNAFTHKGGMHVHAVNKIAHSYEHIEPADVGNDRRVLVSELAGASNIAATLGAKHGIADDKALQRKLLERIQDLEHQGYQFEQAQASFELLLHELRGTRPDFWKLDHYRCVILRRDGEKPSTEAIVKLAVNSETEHRVAEGDGPVNALDGALRKALREHYPQLDDMHLADYRVRVVNPTAESAAKVRVLAEFRAKQGDSSISFTTTGVDENIVNASWQAITDAMSYHLISGQAKD